MAEKKMTRVMALELAIEALEGNEEAIEVLGKMLASLSKPRSNAAGESKARRENLELLNKCLELLEGSDGMAAGEFVGRVPFITTPQKATAVLRLGVELKSVVCEKEGKTNKYRLA